jgi:type I restriction-modification system DNA methylase subunit
LIGKTSTVEKTAERSPADNISNQRGCVLPCDAHYYGQEMDNATAALARMNMILHNNPTAEI